MQILSIHSTAKIPVTQLLSTVDVSFTICHLSVHSPLPVTAISSRADLPRAPRMDQALSCLIGLTRVPLYLEGSLGPLCLPNSTCHSGLSYRVLSEAPGKPTGRMCSLNACRQAGAALSHAEPRAPWTWSYPERRWYVHTKPGAFEHTWLSEWFPHWQNGDVDMISLPFT